MSDYTLPFWIASTEDTNYPSLENDVTVDTVVVGGGLAGIMTAYFLNKEGIKVAIIEAGKIGKGTTGHTTAKITSQHGLIYEKIKKAMGVEISRKYGEANEKAIQTLSGIVSQEQIDCDLEWKDAYIYTQNEKYIDKLGKETEAAIASGIKAHYMEQIPLPYSVLAAMRFTGQAQFHPRKFLLALANKLRERGVSIFENTRAMDIKEGKNCEVITQKGNKVTADNVVIASHYPFYDGKGMYFSRMYPVKSYLIGIRIQEEFPDGMFVTAEEEPGRSLRSHPFSGGRLVLVGGEHHKTGHGGSTMAHYDNLRAFAQETFTITEELYRWSSQDYTTLDSIPYVGRLTSKTPNIYVATGFKKWGMTNCVVTGELIKDLIVKGESEWEDVYSPQRGNIGSSAIKFATENADVAYQLISGKLESPNDDVNLEKGEGKAIDYKGKRTGAYKDEEGNLYLLDITCTHMGCELKWNDGEKTWDCPCHGSRFSYKGEIVEGPALHNLKHPDEGRNVVEPNVFKDKK